MENILVPNKWESFELVDAGDYAKLERWGNYLIARPEPRAIWNRLKAGEWNRADAKFEKEKWVFQNEPPREWKIEYKLEKGEGAKIVFGLRPTDFKHTGVFPEQAVNWEWIFNQIRERRTTGEKVRVLNLFAYTGGATMAAGLAGAQVTHVDASKPAMMWASDNCKLSQLPPDAVRWIQEDVNKFVEREIRRGSQYDAIIMDPPRFGRGAGGEMWKLEENLPKLVHQCKKILSPTPLFVLINAYTADLSHLAIKYVLEDALRNDSLIIESGEIGLPIPDTKRILPCGIFVRASNF